MKRVLFVVLALVLLAGCVDEDFIPEAKFRALRPEINDAISPLMSDGLNFVLVTKFNNAADISIHLFEPITENDFAEYCSVIFDHVQSIVESSGLPFYQLRINLKNDDETVYILSTNDFEKAWLGDYREFSSSSSNIVIEDWLNPPPPVEPEKSLFDTYLEENRITLTGRDVQFNMSNNVDKPFYMKGTGELSSYYNYGFDSSIEPNYFSVRFRPSGGTYSDEWYLYFHRNSFRDLFDKLMLGSAYMEVVCNIPSSLYNDRQGNMARVIYVAW
ncbi:MAG: hypothetical protein FWG72_06190 [Oscillospiraceae bacterium]|nr:hypothetical protein [Oscillospiraceae bacterium]